MVSCRWVFIAIARLKNPSLSGTWPSKRIRNLQLCPQKRWLTFWGLKGRNHQVLLKNRIDNSWSQSYFKKQLRNVIVILMRWMNSRCSFAQDEWCVFFPKPCGFTMWDENNESLQAIHHGLLRLAEALLESMPCFLHCRCSRLWRFLVQNLQNPLCFCRWNEMLSEGCHKKWARKQQVVMLLEQLDL